MQKKKSRYVLTVCFTSLYALSLIMPTCGRKEGKKDAAILYMYEYCNCVRTSMVLFGAYMTTFF